MTSGGIKRRNEEEGERGEGGRGGEKEKRKKNFERTRKKESWSVEKTAKKIITRK